MRNKILFILINISLIFSSPLPQLTIPQIDGSYFLVQISSTDPSQCSQCQEQQKQLIKAGVVLQGVVKVGKANSNTIPSLRSLKLNRNPSYVLFKGSVTDYVQLNVKPTRISFLKFVLQQIKQTIRLKDQKLFGQRDKKSRDERRQKRDKPKQKQKAKKDSNGVINLSDRDFESLVLENDQAWFVQFYSPSCGHCQRLQPQYNKLPSKIGKRVKIAKIDATQNRVISQKYQIRGFPTLLLFVGDKKTPIKYESQRTSDAIVQWLISQPIGEQKVEFLQLTKQIYDKQCSRRQLKQLDFIEDVMKESKGKPLKFFYSRPLSVFEEKLMISDRKTPKIVSIWDSINSYKVYNGNPQKEQLDGFITRIMERRTWIKLQNDKISSIIFQEKNQEL